MYSRRELALLLVIVGLVMALTGCDEDGAEVLTVVVKNETGAALSGLVMWSNDLEVSVPEVGVGSDVAVEYASGQHGENALYVRDAAGVDYLLHPYFEGQLKGLVTVTIVATDPLEGEVTIATSSYPEAESALTPVPR